MRSKLLGKRKRQRPSYLHDFLDDQDDVGEQDQHDYDYQDKDEELSKTPSKSTVKSEALKFSDVDRSVVNVEGEEERCCLCNEQVSSNTGSVI